MSNNKLFTPSFCLLFVANFVVVAVYFLLMTTMATYALGTYDGCSSSEAGFTASIFLIAAVISRVACGRYAEYFGLRTFTLVALVIQLVSCVAYSFSGVSMGLLIVIRFFHGLSFGIANTTLPAIVAKTLPYERLGEGTGYFMLSNSLALGIGPMVGMFVSSGINYDVVFIICSVTSALALACTLVVKMPKTATVDPGKFTLSSFLNPKAARFSVFMFIVAIGYAAINTYLQGCAIDRGLSFYAPFTFMMYSIFLLLTRPLTGKIADRFGENAVLYASILCNCISLLLAAFASDGIPLMIVGVFMALGFGTCMSIGQAVCVKIVGQKNSAIGISTFFFMCDSGCGIAPFFWGMVLSASGYQTMYLACAAAAFLALPYYHFEHGRAAQPWHEA